MRFFISGEIHASVSEEWRDTSLAVEGELNAYCVSREYGPGVTNIGIIPIILPADWPVSRTERRLFQRRASSADYRTHIEYSAFKAADRVGRIRLLESNILEAVTDLGRKAGRALEVDLLIEDIKTAVGRVVSMAGG